jgi:mono/diheme cytochrome c family protein
MNSLPPAGGGGPGGGFGGFGPPAAAAPEPGPANLERGAAIYREACVACHGEAGDGGHGGGPTLIAGLDAETVRVVAGAGQNSMPGFGRIYSAAEINDLSGYIIDVLASGE